MNRSIPARLCSAVLSVALVLAAATAAVAVHASDFPTRPLRIIVPLGQGSGTDSTTRFIADRLGSVLGQPVIVENRPGADMLIGMQTLLNAPADGYAMVVTTPTSMVINPLFNKSLPYDPQRDIRPLTTATRGAGVLVTGPGTTFRSLADAVAASRQAPGTVSMGYYGLYYRLGGLSLEQMAGVRFNNIPYKAAGPIFNDLMNGSVDMALMEVGSSLPLIRAGKLRALAVGGRQRHADLPEVPTMRESGFPEYDVTGWFGLGVRTQTPEPIARTLEEALRKVVTDPQFRAYVAQNGNSEVVGGSGQDAAAMIAADRARYAPLIGALGGAPR